MNRSSWIRVFVVVLLALALTALAAAAQDAPVPGKQAPASLEPGESPSPAAAFHESEPNDSFATADPLPLHTPVAGRINPGADWDYYVIDATDYSRLIFDIDAWAYGSPMDAVMCVYGHDLVEIACSDDNDGLDSMLFLPNYDDEDRYYVSVREYDDGERYGRDFTYTLSVYNPLFISATTGGKVAGLPFAAADILSFAQMTDGTDKWMMFFDASEVGISRNVNNFGFYPDGYEAMLLALGFQGNQNITDRDGNQWTATPHDVVVFDHFWYGLFSSGEFWSWKLLKGEWNGLTTRGERLDAIARFSDYAVTVSTMGAASAWSVSKDTTITGRDEDLLAVELEYWEGTGDWWMTLDGSTVPGLAEEDIVAASWVESTGYDYWALVISGSGRVGGQRFNQKDIFLVDADSLEVTPYFHGPDHGFDYLIDGID